MNIVNCRNAHLGSMDMIFYISVCLSDPNTARPHQKNDHKLTVKAAYVLCKVTTSGQSNYYSAKWGSQAKSTCGRDRGVMFGRNKPRTLTQEAAVCNQRETKSPQ